MAKITAIFCKNLHKILVTLICLTEKQAIEEQHKPWELKKLSSYYIWLTLKRTR